MPKWLLLIVIGAVLLVVAYYLARPDAPVHPSWVGWVCGLLGACALVVGVILAILAIIALGTGKPLADVPNALRFASGPLLLGFLSGASLNDPTPPSSSDTGGYSWRWLLNAALVAISILSVIGNVVSAMGSASWLGISEIAWHWVLLAFATATALNTAFNRTPPITAPPTQPRLAVERQVHAIRKRAA
jgi:hypothetical protein